MIPHLRKHLLDAKAQSLFWCIGFFALFSIALFSLFAAPTGAYTAPPSIINYQGKLLESGSAVTSSQDMTFIIYDASAGGNIAYVASGTTGAYLSVSVTPSSGIFSVDLGGTGTNSIDPDIFANNTSLYLEVVIDTATLTPRKQISSAGYALNSRYLMGVSASTTATSTYIPISDGNGSFEFLGKPTGSDVASGSVYINPDAGDVTADETLFGIAVGDSARFRVDEDGDIYGTGSLAVSSTLLSATATIEGGLIVTSSLSTGDLVHVRNNGTSRFVIDESGNVGINSSTPRFSLGVVGDAFIGGALNVNDGILYAGTNGFVGINSSTPGFALSVNGTSYFNASSTLPGLIVGVGGSGGSISLNGSVISDWSEAGGGGGDVTKAGNNDFTGINTFAVTTTFAATTTITTGPLQVGTGFFYADPDAQFVGVNSSTKSSGKELQIQGDTLLNGGLHIQHSARDLEVEVDTYLRGHIKTPSSLDKINLDNNLNTTSNLGGMVIDDQYAYVALSDGVDSAIEIIELTAYQELLGNAQSVTSSDLAALGGSVDQAADIEVQNGIAYIPDRFDGYIDVIDVSNPGLPSRITTYVSTTPTLDDMNDIPDIHISGNILYVPSRGNDKVFLISIADPLHPQLLSTIENGVNATLLDGPSFVQTVGKYLYVSSNASVANDSISIFDVSDPYTPVELGTIDDSVANVTLGGVEEFALKGGYLYAAADTDEALEVINVASSTNPTHVASVADGGGSAPYLDDVVAMVFVGDYLLLYDDPLGDDQIQVLDVQYPDFISSVTSYELAIGGLGSFIWGVDIGFWRNNLVLASGPNLGFINLGENRITSAEVGQLNTQDFRARDTEVFGRAKFNGGVSINGDGLIVNTELVIGPARSNNGVTSTIGMGGIGEFKSYVSSTATTTNDYAFVFDTASVFENSTSSYLVSVRNAGSNVFSVSANGDVQTTGEYFGQGANIGVPGQPGDLAEQVDIAHDDLVEPGDVLVVDPNTLDTYRRSGGAHEPSVAGVVSTNPTITVGRGRTEHTAVMAMIGRVPVKVTDQGGPIARGDLLVTASSTGYAMKYNAGDVAADKMVGIIGVALDTHQVGTSSVMALVKSGWVNSRRQTIAEIEQGLAALAEAEGVNLNQDPADLHVEERDGQLANIKEDLNLGGHSIRNIAGLVGQDNIWQIDAQGRFITHVEIDDQGEIRQEPIYALQSKESEYVISGSGRLDKGFALVVFDSVSREIIDPKKPMKVSVTLTDDAKGVYVNNKTVAGFQVHELDGGSSRATFDWVVIAQRKGDEEEEENVEEPPAEEPPVEEPPVEEPPVEEPPAEEPPVEEPPAEELPAEEPLVEEPPAEEPPVEEPPAEEPLVEEPPVEEPPVEEPPVEEPPAEQPPAEQPPAEQPPAEQPPAEQPPAEQPPAEQPPAEQPPVEEPPVEEPPAEEPPVEQPPAEEPPVEQPPAEEPPAEQPPAE